MAGVVTFLQLGRLGRFGNQLFQIAGVIGIARKNNMDFCFPKWENTDNKDRFGSTEDCSIQKFFENELPAIDENKHYQYRWVDWGYHDVRLNPDVNYDLCGHFQSEKYFKHCMDEVRHYMKMKDEHDFMKEVCAIHFRAGDYQEGGDNVYHPRMTMQYYNDAMSKMPQGTRFMVFSDDQDKAKEMFGDRVEYSTGKDYIEDFKLMKACNHFICANSSFSLMAAILCKADDKVVVCPKMWFGAIAGITGADCYPENSIVI